MSAPVRTRRKNGFNIFREAQKLSSFDEFPMLRPEVDPQLHLSRNEVDQPFHLVCEKDTVLAQFSGESRVEFANGSVRFFDMGRGDFVYVPAGAAHRLLTVETGVVARYKASAPGAETIIWYCDGCGGEISRHEGNATQAPAQQLYQEACEAFNGDAARRRCGACGSEHVPVDLSPFRWQAVADKLLEPEDE